MPEKRSSSSGLPLLLKGEPAARLRAAEHLSHDVSGPMLVDLLSARGWEADPTSFGRVVQFHLESLGETLLPLIAAAMRSPEGGELTTAQRELMVALSNSRDERLLSAIASAFSAGAGPGDARTATSMLQQGLRPALEGAGVHLEPLMTPVAKALLECGGAEIARVGLTSEVLLSMQAVKHDHPHLVRQAFQSLARGEHPDPLGNSTYGIWDTLEELLEVALAEGMPWPLVPDLLRVPGRLAVAVGSDMLFRALDPRACRPLLRAAMIDGLAQGRWPEFAVRRALLVAMRGEPPIDVEFSREGLLQALSALRTPDEFEDVEPSLRDPWVALVAHGWCVEFGLERPLDDEVPRHLRLDGLSRWSHLASGINVGVRRYLEGREPSPVRDRALEILSLTDRPPQFVGVALLTLPQRARDREWRFRLDREAVEADLTALVRSVTASRSDGWGFFPPDVTRVVLSDTPRDDSDASDGILVWRDMDSLVGAPTRTYRMLTGLATSREDALIACAIFFVHELAHVVQGLQSKRTVTTLRQAASEFTLAHLDLEADDIAARIVAAHTGLSVARIKDLEGRMSPHFPATFHHTHASVARKSVRLVGLRVDYLIRIANAFGMDVNEPGYSFVEVPPGEGTLLIMWRRDRLLRVLAEVSVSRAEAEWLTRAALQPIELGEVDERLGGMLARATEVRRDA